MGDSSLSPTRPSSGPRDFSALFRRKSFGAYYAADFAAFATEGDRMWILSVFGLLWVERSAYGRLNHAQRILGGV
ncbi:MAG TPA: hypothetical protein VFO34_11435 [Candidatus Acidoferrales bacterium]|nr:hypothetical protein [Candidatus Acidoferrales bacterium]